VVLDEAHSTHIGGEVEDVVDALDRAVARILVAQVGLHVLDRGGALVPLADRLVVDRADAAEATATRIRSSGDIVGARLEVLGAMCIFSA
jgi:hypothetical protein